MDKTTDDKPLAAAPAGDDAPAPGAGSAPAVGKEAGAESHEAYEKFRSCAVEVLNVSAEQVVPEATFKDLDADSLDLVELVMALEEAFEITVEEAELDGIETIGQAFSLVTSKI